MKIKIPKWCKMKHPLDLMDGCWSLKLWPIDITKNYCSGCPCAKHFDPSKLEPETELEKTLPF